MQIDYSSLGIGGTTNNTPQIINQPIFYYDYIPNDTGIIF